MGEGKEDMNTNRPCLCGHRFDQHNISGCQLCKCVIVHPAYWNSVVVNPRLQPNQIVVQPQGGVGITDGIVE